MEPPVNGPLTLEDVEGIWVRIEDVNRMIGMLLLGRGIREVEQVHEELIRISTPVHDITLFEREALLVPPTEKDDAIDTGGEG
jgi:hypothetical protein